MKKLILFFFVKLLLLNTFYSFAYSSEIKWIDKGFNTSDNYIQEYRKGFKKVNIDGKSEKFDITYYSTFPNKKYNKKNWLCREWTIKEYLNDENFIAKSYSLNDCLPCLDKGSGHICSYPYFKMEFKTKLYDEILMEREDNRYSEISKDGTIHVKLSINLSPRERVEIVQKKFKKSGKIRLGSRFIKYNTKYRKIPSEGSEPIIVARDIQSAVLFGTLFPRLKRDVNLSIEKKEKLILREKDINTIISIDPAAKKFKFQTRE